MKKKILPFMFISLANSLSFADGMPDDYEPRIYSENHLIKLDQNKNIHTQKEHHKVKTSNTESHRRFTTKKDNFFKDFNKFEISVLGGVNRVSTEHLSRNALPREVGLCNVNQPKKDHSHISEVNGFYNLSDYPLSIGVSYSYIGKANLRGAPTFIQSICRADNPSFSQYISGHNISFDTKYNMKEINKFTPYIGIGLGHIHYNTKLHFNFSSSSETLKKKGIAFTQNLFLGTKYKISDKTSVLFQAKYIHLNRLKNGGSWDNGNSFHLPGVHNISLMGGISFKL